MQRDVIHYIILYNLPVSSSIPIVAHGYLGKLVVKKHDSYEMYHNDFGNNIASRKQENQIENGNL